MAQKIGLEAVLQNSNWNKGVKGYLSDLDKMDKNSASFGSKIGGHFQGVGKAILGVSAIIGGAAAVAGAAIAKFTIDGIGKAADLEAQLSTIAATLNMTKEQVAPLNDLLLELGLDPNLKVSATEAADAIENLARNGLNMTQILDGAAHSTVLLANATGAEFGQAADIATDVMAQFNIEAANMGTAVDQITAVTNLSKFTIDDYGFAIAQAGGVASSVGVSFEDFNTTIAATSPLFASGSDAGTSFKTFLTSLNPKSAEAAGLMKSLGLSFFDANGQMKSMADISEELNRVMFDQVTFTSQVNNMTAEQTAQKKMLEGQLNRTNMELFKYEIGLNGVAQSEEDKAVSVDRLNRQHEAAMNAYGGLATSMGTTVSVTRELTEAERMNVAQTIFGSDAMRTAFGLAEAGAVIYTDVAEAAKALGVTQEAVNAVIEGGVTQFEALQLQMGNIDAEGQAATRMDNFKGSLEILQGTIETLQIKIGQVFLPMLQKLTDWASQFVAQHSPAITAFFERFTEGITKGTEALAAGQSPMDAFALTLNTMGFDGTGAAAALTAVWGAITLVIGAVGMVLQPIADAIGKFVEWQDVGIAAAGILAYTLAPAVGALIAAVWGLVWPIGAAVLAVAALRTAWESDFLGIQTKTTEAISAITTAFEPFTAAIQTHGMGALAEIKNFASGTQIEFTNLAIIFGAFKLGISSLFTTIVDSITTNLPTWTANLKLWGDAAWQWITNTAIPFAITEMGKWVTIVTNFVSDNLPQWQAKLKTWGDAAWQWIVDATAVATTEIGKFTTAVTTGLESKYETFKSTVTKYEGSFKGLSTVIDGNEKAVGRLGLALSKFQTDTGKLDFSKLSIEIGRIGETFSVMWGIVRPIMIGFGVLVGFVMGIQGILSLNVFSETLSNTGKAFQLVIDGMTQVLQGMRIAWGGTFEFITGLMTLDFPQALAGLQQVWSGTMLFMGATFGTAWSLITLGFTTIRDAIINAFKDLGLTETFQNIVDSFKWLIDEVKRLLGISSPSTVFFDIGADIIRGAREGMESLVGTLVSKALSIVNAVVDGFKKAVERVKQIGKDIIQGLINGIASMRDALIQKITEMANLIPQWMKDALGIKSPSKVMIKIGVDTMRGFIVGLETGSVRLVEATEQIARTFTNAILRGTERAVDAFSGILDNWSSVGSGFADTMQTALEGVQVTFDELMSMGGEAGPEHFNLIRLMDQLQSGIGKYQQNNRVLDTLQQQADLIDLIRESGGQPATVLAGITLGRDADPQQMLDVVNRMMETFNGRLENSIRIASQGFQELVDSLRANRHSIEQIEAQFADAKLDQLERYKREVTRLDEKIAQKEQSILTTGDTSELYHIQSLNTLRERTLDAIRLFLEQRQRIEATLAKMPTFRGERAQAGATAFRERFIDPLVASFDQLSVEMRGSALTQLDRYLGMLQEYSAWMDHAAAAEKHARKAIEGFGEGAQQRIESLLNVIYDVGTPTASRSNAIQSLRDFAASLNAIRTELTTRGAGRETSESIIERATGGFDQLAAYKVAIADVDKRIQSLTDTIEETGNAAFLPQLRSLDAQRLLDTQELKNFLVQVSQLEGAFRDIKNLSGPGETSAQRFVDEQIQPILDAFSAPMRPQERDAWLRAARDRVALVNKFVDQMRAVEKLQQRISGVEGFEHLADEFASMADIAMPEAQRTALVNTLTSYITQMERLFALQRDISVGVGADPLIGRFQTERLDTIEQQLQNINLAEAERARLIEQYRIEQERVLAIQQKQSQLNYLEQQLSLFDKIVKLDDEFGDLVPVSDIFAGVQFGVNASIDSLVGAVSKALDAMIRVTNKKLGIASPSKVFAKIGGQMMEGLSLGIERMTMVPMRSMALATSSVAQAPMISRSMTVNMNVGSINNGMDDVMFEAKVRQIVRSEFG